LNRSTSLALAAILTVILGSCAEDQGQDDGGASLPPIEFRNDGETPISRIVGLCEGTPKRLVNVTTPGGSIYNSIPGEPFGPSEVVGVYPDEVRSWACSAFVEDE
jgi:hypothetical protein